MRRRAGSLWVMSELYHPELTSTGHYMTLIAERLAGEHRVRVLCGQPTYSAHGVRAPSTETRNEVDITRCRGTTFHKDRLVGRACNAATLTLSVLLQAIRRVRLDDVVLVVTNPPTLPFVAALACRLRRARLVVLIHDRYPDLAVAVGAVGASSPLVRVSAWAQRRLLRSAHRVVVIGRDVEEAVVDLGVEPDRVAVITNWADVSAVVPLPRAQRALRAELGLTDRPVVVYAGTFGRANDLASLVAAAAELDARSDVAVALIGEGPRRAWVERELERLELDNVVVAGPFPRSDQSDLLGVGDVVVIPMVAGVTGVSVPSRMYNAFAAGKPVLAAMEPDSELARTIREEEVGWVVSPEEPALLAAAIERAFAEGDLEAMGRRARELAERRFAADAVLEEWSAFMRSVRTETRQGP